MNPNEIKRRFPRASAGFVAANREAKRPGQPAKLEQGSPDVSLRPAQTEKRDRRPRFVCVTDVRVRLLDDDNLCEKYHLDALRRLRPDILPDDSAYQTRIFSTQRKCVKGELPHTEIEIFEILP